MLKRVAFVFTLLLAGCNRGLNHSSVAGWEPGIYKWVDTTNRVACYTTAHGNISCVRP